MREIQRAGSTIMISENTQNENMETVISLKWTVNAMKLFPRSHCLECMKSMRCSQKVTKKVSRCNRNRRVRKETRIDTESAPHKTLETTVDFSGCLLSNVIKSTKRDGSTTMMVTPLDSPFRPVSTPTLDENASPHAHMHTCTHVRL